MARRISVALVRSLVDAQPNDVCIAIDALRATTTLAVLFERGCRGVWLAPDVDSARRLGQARGRLVCGEKGGLPPPGFDYGNSPVEFMHADLTGREIVFATSNGTGTLRACAAGRHVYAGAFVNLTAAVRTALRSLDELGDGVGRLLIACAGSHNRFSIEDVACAGLMVERVLGNDPGTALDDAAESARRLYGTFGSPEAAVETAGNARILRKLGLAEDVTFCGRLDSSEIVPELSTGEQQGDDMPRWPLYLASATV